MKILKRLSFILLAVCLAFTSFVFAACIKEVPPDPPKEDLGDPAKDGYEISVSYPDGAPVKGSDTGSSRRQVCIVLLDENDNRLTEPQMGVVDEFGVARINYTTPGEYTISLLNIPTGYVYTPVKTSATASKHNIRLDHVITSYPVELKYSDGSPASNITVNFMLGNTRVTSLKTGNDGKATSANIIAGIYSVALSLPENQGYLPVSTTMGGDKVEIEIFDINALKYEDKDKLDEAGMNKWAEKLNSPALNLYPFATQADYYEYTAHATKGHPAYYAIYPEKRGTYNFHVWSESNKNYQVLFYGLNFESVHDDLTLKTGGNSNRPLDLDAKKVYFFAVSTTDDECNLTFALSKAIPSPTTTEFAGTVPSEGVTLNVEFEMNQAIIKFRPSVQGVYVIESISNYDTLLLEYASNNQPIMNEDGSYKGSEFDDSGEGKNFKFTTEITQSYISGTFQYRVTIKDANVEFPTSIKVKITRTGDARPDRVYNVTDATTTQTQKYANQDGYFNWMQDVDAPYETYKNENGIWCVKFADGIEHPLVIAITKNIYKAEYSFATIEYMGEDTIKPSEDPDEEQQPVKANEKNTYLTVFNDIEDYTSDKTVVEMTNYRAFIATYKELVNKDGVYELNDELKTFAERYMNQRYQDFLLDITDNKLDGNKWLLCCGYYE